MKPGQACPAGVHRYGKRCSEKKAEQHSGQQSMVYGNVFFREGGTTRADLEEFLGRRLCPDELDLWFIAGLCQSRRWIFLADF